MSDASIELIRVAVPGEIRQVMDDLASGAGGDGSCVLLAAFAVTLYRHASQEQLSIRLTSTRWEGQEVDVTLRLDVLPDRRFAEVIEEISGGLPRGRPDELSARATVADGDAWFGARKTAEGWDVELGPDAYARSYLNLLAEAVRRPDASVGGLAMLPAAEAAKWAEQINAAHDVYTDLRPVHAPFEEKATREPDLVAIEQGQVKITYGELDRRANLLAGRLMDAGIGLEQTVGVLTERSVDLVVALLGIWKAGAAYVPLDQKMPAERISVIAGDAALSAVVTQERFADLLDDRGLPAVVVSDQGAADAPGVNVSLDHAAFIYYTSGSTGVPKGVVTDHRCAAGRLEWLARRYPLRPGDKVVHKTPLIFDVSLWEIVGALSAGATIMMADQDAEADVAHLGRLLSAERTVFAHFVPSMLSAYLNLASDRTYPDLRWVQLSGEAMPTRLLDRFTEHFDAEFHSLYGQTETSEVAAWEGRSCSGGTYVPLGRQIGIYRLYVMDMDLNLVPPGVPGELCVAGVGGLARGYHERPGLTAERFVPHPYPIEPGERLYRTGDLVVVTEDGVICYLGRLDHQTKIRGCRVETGEVEAVLARHQAVGECAVVARTDDEGANELVAYVVGNGASAADLAAHAERYLPSYMLPAVYVALDGLPIGPSGKLDRMRLPAPTADDRAALATESEPLGPVEEWLCQVWQEILEIDRVGVSDKFFVIGGNSLKALRMLNRVAESFGLEYPVRDFFAGPTIGQMAASIESYLIEMVDAMTDDEASEYLSLLKG